MALSICSLSSLKFVPSGFVRTNRLCCHAQADGGAPSSLATQTASSLCLSQQRRSANYAPSVWEDGYIQSLKINIGEKDIASQVTMLEEVRHLLGKEKEPVDQLRLVDVLQQLGVAYHFEKDINDILATIHRSTYMINMAIGDNLFAVSLMYKLLREHGFHISPDIFNRFKDNKGCFKDYLRNDIKGMLSLYEASFLTIEEDQNQMEEARDFAIKCLRDLTADFSVEPSLKEQVTYALELPLHWRVKRLHSRWFIDQYERDEDMNPSLLNLAKLDFNIVQAMYKRELKELSRWWIDLGLTDSLHFARDRLVENYLWTIGWVFEPKFSRSREAMTKVISLVTTIDDIYDVYGSLEELVLFTDAVDRWDASSIEQLPYYMKLCFMALFNTTNDTTYMTLKLKGVDVLPHLKRAWTDLCKSSLVEAKWYHAGYKPTLKEYLDNAWISISAPLHLTYAYCTSEDLTKEALEFFNVLPDVVYHSSLIFRLYDDLGTSTAELERGDVPKAIQCYMQESKVSEATAREYISEMIVSTWKQLNSDHLANSSFEESFKKVALNIPSMAKCFYGNGDGYGEPGGETKDQVIALIMESVPL